MKKNHWNLPYSNDYKQFKLKKFFEIRTDDYTVRYCVIPGKNGKTKPPIVMLQGMGLTMENWSIDFLKTLDDYTLYLIDPIKSMDLKDYATSVFQITKDIPKFYFLGYSFGSFVIQEYMNRYPLKQIEKVIFIAGASLCDYRLHLTKKNTEIVPGYDYQLVLQQGFAAIKARLAQESCFLKTGSKTDIPFLFIKAEDEHMFKQDYVFCGKNEIIVKNVDHNLLHRRPIFIAKQIVAFLNGVVF